MQEAPTKCVVTRTDLHVRCKVQYIDFEGRSDGDSILKVVASMKPRRAIVVRGKEEAAMGLAEYIRQVKT